jgi:hypothetical protein
MEMRLEQLGLLDLCTVATARSSSEAAARRGNDSLIPAKRLFVIVMYVRWP